MNMSTYRHIVGENGFHGRVLGVTHEPDNFQLCMFVQLDNGQQMLVPVADVSLQEDGTYYVPRTSDDFDVDNVDTETSALQHVDQNTVVLPLVTENVHIQKQRVETGKVRVTKHVRQWEEQIDEPRLQQNVNITRVPLNKPVAEPPSVRSEGSTTIIPVLEEVLVVEKRLMLKEEIHITTRQTEEVNPQTVTLRSEEVEIERVSETHDEDK